MKQQMTHRMRSVVNDGMDILGGAGNNNKNNNNNTEYHTLSSHTHSHHIPSHTNVHYQDKQCSQERILPYVLLTITTFLIYYIHDQYSKCIYRKLITLMLIY